MPPRLLLWSRPAEGELRRKVSTSIKNNEYAAHAYRLSLLPHGSTSALPQDAHNLFTDNWTKVLAVGGIKFMPRVESAVCSVQATSKIRGQPPCDTLI